MATPRLVRLSSLLLVVAGLGCNSNDQADPDKQAVPAAATAAERRGGDVVDAEWPSTDLAAFVFARLDLTSFRNSTGPMREPGQRFFSDLGVHPTTTSAAVAVHDGEEWLYSVRVLGRRDYNRDLVDEVAICFTDRAQNGGSYSTRTPLLLQLIGRRAVALDFEIDPETGTEECAPVK